MDTNEIVRELRCCNQPRGHRCSECTIFGRYEYGTCKSTVDKLAADLIESLQTENNSLAANGGRYMAIADERYKMYEEAMKRAEESEQRLNAAVAGQETLQKALAESQRREKAAGCDGCAEWGKWENEIEYGYPSPCTRCKRRCKDNWSGPQEAGEEEQDG